MPRKSVNTSFCSHIPYSSGRVPTSCQQHINSRVKGHAIDATQVTVVVPYYLYITNKVSEEDRHMSTNSLVGESYTTVKCTGNSVHSILYTNRKKLIRRSDKGSVSSSVHVVDR